MIKNNAGSVLHILLLAIVLFAAISAVVTTSGKGGTDIVGPEKAKTYAGQIMNAAAQISNAVQKVMLVNNCSDTQVSFEKAPFDGSDTNYVNPNAPSDFSCHIYHPNGGGIAPIKLSDEIYDPAQEGVGFSYGVYMITGDAAIMGVGSTCDDAACADLLFWLPNLKLSVCNALNDKLGLAPIGTVVHEISAFSSDDDAFDGDYKHTGSGSSSSILGSGSPNEEPVGKKSGCFSRSTGNLAWGHYSFYHTIIAR